MEFDEASGNVRYAEAAAREAWPNEWWAVDELRVAAPPPCGVAEALFAGTRCAAPTSGRAGRACAASRRPRRAGPPTTSPAPTPRTGRRRGCRRPAFFWIFSVGQQVARTPVWDHRRDRWHDDAKRGHAAESVELKAADRVPLGHRSLDDVGGAEYAPPPDDGAAPTPTIGHFLEHLEVTKGHYARPTGVQSDTKE